MSIKKILMRLLSIFAYMTIMMIVLGFHLKMLVDLRLMVLVLLGTLILSVPFFLKDEPSNDKGQLLAYKALESGYLQAFILLFMSLSQVQDIDNIPYEIAMNCRPILYGYCLYILLETKPHLEKQKEIEVEEVVCPSVQQEWSIAEIEEKFKSMGLTRREIEVAKAICQGMTNGEIAEALFISEGTVKKHVSHIFEKLHIEKREEIIHKLYDESYIKVP